MITIPDKIKYRTAFAGDITSEPPAGYSGTFYGLQVSVRALDPTRSDWLVCYESVKYTGASPAHFDIPASAVDYSSKYNPEFSMCVYAEYDLWNLSHSESVHKTESVPFKLSMPASPGGGATASYPVTWTTAVVPQSFSGTALCDGSYLSITGSGVFAGLAPSGMLYTLRLKIDGLDLSGVSSLGIVSGFCTAGVADYLLPRGNFESATVVSSDTIDVKFGQQYAAQISSYGVNLLGLMCQLNRS